MSYLVKAFSFIISLRLLALRCLIIIVWKIQLEMVLTKIEISVRKFEDTRKGNEKPEITGQIK
jgi:hypothetical protein